MRYWLGGAAAVVMLALYGFVFAPWFFGVLKGMFENSDLGTIVGIIGIILTASPAGFAAILVGAFVAAVLE